MARISWYHVKNLISDLALFIFTVVGVICSESVQSLRQLKQLKAFHFTWPTAPEVIGAIFVALILNYILDHKGDAEGKKKHFKQRALKHLIFGFFWVHIIDLIKDFL